MKIESNKLNFALQHLKLSFLRKSRWEIFVKSYLAVSTDLNSFVFIPGVQQVMTLLERQVGSAKQHFNKSLFFASHSLLFANWHKLHVSVAFSGYQDPRALHFQGASIFEPTDIQPRTFWSSQPKTRPRFQALRILWCPTCRLRWQNLPFWRILGSVRCLAQKRSSTPSFHPDQKRKLQVHLIFLLCLKGGKIFVSGIVSKFMWFWKV